MQLSNIALATIFITLFTTGSVNAALPRSSSAGNLAAFREYEKATKKAEKEERARVAKLMPGGRERSSTQSRPSPPQASSSSIPAPKPVPEHLKSTLPTKSTKPVVGPYPPPPSSSKSAESTGKPAQPPPKKPTITPQPKPKQPLQPKVSPAPNQATTSSQPATGRQAPAPLIPPPGPPTMTPRQFEEQQQASQRSTAQASKATKSTASGVSSVAKLARTWGGSAPSSKPVSSTSSASPSKPSPQPTPGTSSEPVGPPPKMTSIPEDADFTHFKEAIEQRKYSDAMKIVHKLPEGKSLEPYSRLLASFDVSKIIEMVRSYEKDLIETTGGVEVTYSNPYPTITMGLFLIHADDAKFGELLQKAKLKPEIQDEALLFSIEHNANLTPEGFIRVFKTLTHMPSRALEAAAKPISGCIKLDHFPGLIDELEKRNILDKDLVNFAYNALFVEACGLNLPFFAEKYYKQATILSSMYAKAIIAFCAKEHRRWELFNWLLEHAGGDDLFLTIIQGSGKFKEDVQGRIGKRYVEVSHKARPRVEHGTKSP